MSLLRNDILGLSQTSMDALDRRLSTSSDYSISEIQEIAQRSERLFPKDFEISKEQTEVFRTLAATAQVRLHKRGITSHRKYIGPVIVWIKTISANLVGVILKDTLNSQEIFNRYMVRSLAREITKNQHKNTNLLAQGEPQQPSSKTGN